LQSGPPHSRHLRALGIAGIADGTLLVVLQGARGLLEQSDGAERDGKPHQRHDRGFRPRNVSHLYSWHGHLSRMAASATSRKSSAPDSGLDCTKIDTTCTICSGVAVLGWQNLRLSGRTRLTN